MIGLVCQGEGEEFDAKHPESYMYETLGGNNSRTALVELLKENPALKDDKRFSHRMVSVYSNLTDEEAQLLAVKHNRQQSFVHSMTTQDKVCILLLFVYATNYQHSNYMFVHEYVLLKAGLYM